MMICSYWSAWVPLSHVACRVTDFVRIGQVSTSKNDYGFDIFHKMISSSKFCRFKLNSTMKPKAVRVAVMWLHRKEQRQNMSMNSLSLGFLTGHRQARIFMEETTQYVITCADCVRIYGIGTRDWLWLYTWIYLNGSDPKPGQNRPNHANRFRVRTASSVIDSQLGVTIPS